MRLDDYPLAPRADLNSIGGAAQPFPAAEKVKYIEVATRVHCGVGTGWPGAGLALLAAQQVLRELDLQVPEHSVFAFLGNNGAGKSTTIRIITGLLRQDGGQVWVLGMDIGPAAVGDFAAGGVSG